MLVQLPTALLIKVSPSFCFDVNVYSAQYHMFVTQKGYPQYGEQRTLILKVNRK